VVLEERQDSIVEHIGGNQGILAVVEFGPSDLGVSVDKGLLIDASDTLKCTYVEGVLGSQIAGMLGFDLAVGFFVIFSLLQSDDLAFGKDQAFLGDLGLQGLQSQLEDLQVMAEPDAADTAGGDEKALLAQFVGDADLPPGRLFEGELDHGLFDLGLDAVLDDGLAFGYLPQGFFAAGLIEFLEAVEAVS